MRWLWVRKRGDGHAAHKAAVESLAETRDQWPEVNRVSTSLRQLRERNHFAEQLQYIFDGNTKGGQS